MIEIKGISKTYQQGNKTVKALNNVNLHIRNKEMVAIVGPSGSGKTSLLNILGCLEKPESGTYLLDGKDINSFDDQQLSFLRASQIGFVFQSFNLIPQLTVLENVCLPFLYNKSCHGKASALHSLESVGLTHRLHHFPNELSGGEIQRAAIARALAIDPTLILADEPTGNLDNANRTSILKLLQTLNNQGKTIVIVTHDDEVKSYCTRRVYMSDGFLHEVAS